MNERTRLKQRKYRIDHKEELAAKKKIYYLENKEHIREYQRTWNAANVDVKKNRSDE